jgi:hypothetical protein
MALIVGGTTVTGTQTLDATTLTGNLPALNGSSLTNLATTTTTGTWTPGFETGSTNSASAKYIKVGKMVFCRTSFYMNNDFTTSGTTLRLTGLPFTAASGNTFAGQGFCHGYSNTSRSNVMVEAGTSTCVFVNSTKNPSLNIDLSNGGQARRHSLDNGPDKWYNIFFTYESSS